MKDLLGLIFTALVAFPVLLLLISFYLNMFLDLWKSISVFEYAICAATEFLVVFWIMVIFLAWANNYTKITNVEDAIIKVVHLTNFFIPTVLTVSSIVFILLNFINNNSISIKRFLGVILRMAVTSLAMYSAGNIFVELSEELFSLQTQLYEKLLKTTYSNLSDFAFAVTGLLIIPFILFMIPVMIEKNVRKIFISRDPKEVLIERKKVSYNKKEIS